MWDPQQYLHFAGERSRPFFELTGRVRAQSPRRVADLGCGPGQLTATLAARWPGAEVTGIDSSAEMIETARSEPVPAGADAGQLRFERADAREWQPAEPPDVIVSNALLQWIPGHLPLLRRWAALLPPSGWLAFQVPANFDQPGHVILRELACSDRWRPVLGDVELNRQSADPAEYLQVLAAAGCRVDAWETTYLHVLQGTDPVLDWYKGTGLRPVLTALPAGRTSEFLAEYAARLRAAYPAQPHGTVLPFRRVFVVAQRDD